MSAVEGHASPSPPRRGTVTGQLTAVPLHPGQNRRLWLGIGASGLLVLLFLVSVGVLFREGVGVWGLNHPSVWGLDIVNTIWWVGIAHAGTIVTAFLLLIGQEWRSSLNRFAEAMTLFATMCAGLFPILHLGNPQLFPWLFPYEGSLGLWPQFRSPLMWDVTGFITYLVVSGLFWYVGLIPDFATLRDRAYRRPQQVIYGLLALGWRGSARHWRRWRQAYGLMALLAMLLFVSAHACTAMLLAAGPIGGWHSTLLPAFIMFGSVYSGFAVVALITVAVRAGLGLENLLTELHLEMLGRALLISGLLTAYGYLFLAFHALYSGDAEEIGTLLDRVAGAYAPLTWTALVLNLGALQALWWPRLRRSPLVLVLVGLAVTVGMWLDRFVLLVSGLARGPVPALWRPYVPTVWEWALFAGIAGVFLFLFLLFIRFLPVVSIAEVKEVMSDDAPTR